MKVEVAVLSSPSLIVRTVSAGVKRHLKKQQQHILRAQELCESGGGRPGLPDPNSPYGLCGSKATTELELRHSEFRSCVKVEVAALGSPSLIILTVSVDLKQH